MSYIGDFRTNSVINVKFSTVDTTGLASALSAGPVLACYKDNSTTESILGITTTVSLDSMTGYNNVLVDLSQGTAFYTSGSDFSVTVLAGTVNSVSIRGYELAHFSVDNRNPRGVGRFTIGSSSTTTVLSTTSMTPTCAVADQFKGRVIIFDQNTTTANLRGQATDITANTAGGTLTVSTLTTAPASGDTGIIV